MHACGPAVRCLSVFVVSLVFAGVTIDGAPLSKPSDQLPISFEANQGQADYRDFNGGYN